MIENLTLKNFKGHHSTSLNFDESRLHALVGQNGSGKTSVLQALHCLCRLAGQDSSFARIFQNERSPEFLTTTGQEEMHVEASGFWGHTTPVLWKAGYHWQKNQIPTPPWFPKVFWQVDESAQKTDKGWHTSLSSAEAPIPQALKFALYLKLAATNLEKPSYHSGDGPPRVEFDGSGLASALDYIRDEYPDNFQAIQEMLRRVVPSVKKVGIRRENVVKKISRLIEVNGKKIPYEEEQELRGEEFVLDMTSGERIRAHALSEGTVLALGLLTALMNPRQPNLVLLDDVEQGLHPLAQREFISILKEIIQENRNLQIIFTTHSPYVVDELTPSQVHVLHNHHSGRTFSKRLDEHQGLEWAQEVLTTGEFWDAEGEEWVAEEITDA
jgi:predicted ATPase